jgi:hypothetical protein
VKTWIVNPQTRDVRETHSITVTHGGETDTQDEPVEGCEFFYHAPTAADAAMAGRRHNLACEALEAVDGEPAGNGFQVIGERLELTVEADVSVAQGAVLRLQGVLEEEGYDVWRDGCALLVLGRRPQGTEGVSAWVSELTNG